MQGRKVKEEKWRGRGRKEGRRGRKRGKREKKEEEGGREENKRGKKGRKKKERRRRREKEQTNSVKKGEILGPSGERMYFSNFERRLLLRLRMFEIVEKMEE